MDRRVRSCRRDGPTGRSGNIRTAAVRSITTSSTDRSRSCKPWRTEGPNIRRSFTRGAVDINGDGESDICARSAAGIVCEISQKGGVSTSITGPAWSDAAGWNKPEYYFTIQGADIDGDGRGDLCARDSKGVACEMSNGNGFGAEVRGPAWSDAEGWDKPEYYSTIQFADLNGDGKADVCGRAAKGMVCEISSGTEFPTEVLGPVWSDALGWNEPQYYQSIQFADVNGDARMDLCARGIHGVECSLFDGANFGAPIAGPAWTDAAGWNQPEYMETIRFADVDGDGKADVCGRAAKGVVCEISNGAGFPVEIDGPVWSDTAGWNDAAYYTTIQFADVDGNGLADLCARDSNGIVCELSNGKAFPTEVTGPDWSTAGGWDAPEYDLTVGFADINDDGKDDVCARGWAGLQCALSTGTSFAATTTGPAWSDPEGWGSEEYYSTVRYGGARLHPAKTVPPGGVTIDGGVGASDNNGAASATNAGTDSGGGCGCTTAGRKSDSLFAWLGFGLGVAALALRRRSKNPLSVAQIGIAIAGAFASLTGCSSFVDANGDVGERADAGKNKDGSIFGEPLPGEIGDGGDEGGADCGTANYTAANSRGSNSGAYVRAGYDYSPSVMLDGDYRMWWCCGSTSGGVSGDHICYAEASSLDGPWHSHTSSTPNTHDEVFHGTGNQASFDGTHTCDPSVIRVADGTYYMYYGGLSEQMVASNKWTRIGVASSTDGMNWTRMNSGAPIIDAARDPISSNLPNTYGAGQPSVTFVDGKFYLIHTDTTGLGGNQVNGAGQYVLRSADPTFQTGVEELTKTGFVPHTAATNTTYSLFEAFGSDWQYSDQLDVFFDANSGESSTAVVINTFDKNLTNLNHRIDVPGTWTEEPAIVSRADKHAVPWGGECGTIPLDVMRSVGDSNVNNWDLGHIGVDLNTGMSCACTNLPRAFEGQLLEVPGKPMALVRDGTRLPFALAPPALQLGRTAVDCGPDVYDSIPYSASVFAGNTVYGAPNRPAAYKLDDGKLWPVSCIAELTANDSSIQSVDVGTFDSFKIGSSLFCIQ